MLGQRKRLEVKCKLLLPAPPGSSPSGTANVPGRSPAGTSKGTRSPILPWEGLHLRLKDADGGRTAVGRWDSSAAAASDPRHQPGHHQTWLSYTLLGVLQLLLHRQKRRPSAPAEEAHSSQETKGAAPQALCSATTFLNDFGQTASEPQFPLLRNEKGPLLRPPKRLHPPVLCTTLIPWHTECENTTARGCFGD